MPVAVSPADPSAAPVACRALFPHLPEPDRTHRADRVAGLFAAGELDPAGLLLAHAVGHPEPVGGGFVALAAGAVAAVWPPRADDGPHRAAALDALAAAYRARFSAAGVKVAQAIVPPTDPTAGPALERVGFRPVTQLDYLCRPVRPDDAGAFRPAASPLVLEPAADAPGFGDLLLATYDGTRDCPELNGSRTADEVLAGYRAAAESGPLRWWRAWAGADAVGVVIFGPGPVPGMAELSYLGLVPSARGRGWGRELLRFTLTEAAGGDWLTLSVDARNEPALGLYRAAGFRSYDVQDVYLWKPRWE